MSAEHCPYLVHIFYSFKNKAIEIVLATHTGWRGEHPQLFTGAHVSRQAFSIFYPLMALAENRQCLIGALQRQYAP